MDTEPKRWSILVQRCWGAPPVLEHWERLSHLLHVSCKRCSGSTMSQSTKTLPKSLVSSSSQQTSVWDAHLGLFPLGSKQAVHGPEGQSQQFPVRCAWGQGADRKTWQRLRFPIQNFILHVQSVWWL